MDEGLYSPSRYAKASSHFLERKKSRLHEVKVPVLEYL